MRTQRATATLQLPRNGRKVALGSVLAVLCMLAAACGGAAAGTSSPGSGTSSADKAGLAQAKAIVAAAAQRPTKLPITQAIGKPVPKGKTVAFISCGSPECAQEGALIRQGTNALGWTLQVINTDASPQSENAAFAQVVREKLDVVLFSAIDRSTFSQYIPQLKANGTFVAGAYVTYNAGDGVGYTNETPPDISPVGHLQAAWVTSESGGTGNAVFINIPAYAILADMQSGFDSGLSAMCPKCTTHTLEVPNAAVGVNVPSLVVSYLRAHPQTKYVVASADSLVVGLPAALQAAGLTGIHVIGQAATGTNLQYIHDGQEGASVALDYYYDLWALIDAAARHFAGVPQVPFVLPHLWLLTRQNAPVTNNIFPVIATSQQQYEKLWGVS